MKTIAFANGLVIHVCGDKPSQGQLDTAQALPGLMQMMPTHAARLRSTSWTIHKRPPQEFDTTPFQVKDERYGTVIKIGPEYDRAYAEWKASIATGDPEIDNVEPGMLVLTDIKSLDSEQIEHADQNAGYVGKNLVILEYIGCEYSSDNWVPDHRYTSPKTAFTQDEIDQIFHYFDKNPNRLP
jgi:hypothetical protein